VSEDSGPAGASPQTNPAEKPAPSAENPTAAAGAGSIPPREPAVPPIIEGTNNVEEPAAAKAFSPADARFSVTPGQEAPRIHVGINNNPGNATFNYHSSAREGPQGVNIGVGTNPGAATFNIGNEAIQAAKRKIQLTQTHTSPEYRPFDPHASVVEYSRALYETRVLVVEHTVTGSADANSATWSAIDWLKVEKQITKRYTPKWKSEFSIAAFLDDDSWMDEQIKGALIYVHSSLAPGLVAGIFEHATAEDLRGHLEKVDCRLLVITAEAAGQRFLEPTQARSDVRIWKVGPTTVAADPSLTTFPGATEAAIRSCGALFPGLNALELTRVVDQLLPPLPPPEKEEPAAATTTATESSTEAATPRPKPQRTALQRWHDGERDALMTEQGLTYRPPPGAMLQEDGDSAAGYYFETVEATTLLADSLYTRSPLLLLQYLPALTRLYFSPDLSERYQKGYLRYLLRLHNQNIHRLQASVLLDLFRQYVWVPNPGTPLWRYVCLLQHVMDHPGGKELANQAILALGQAARDAESEWQTLLLQHNYIAAAMSAHAAADDESEDIAYAALASLNLGQNLTASSYKIDAVYRALVILSHNSPAAAIAGCTEGLAGTDTRRHFRALVEVTPTTLRVIMPSLGLLRGVLEVAATHAPRTLAVFAGAVAAEFKTPLKQSPQTGEPPEWLFGDGTQRAAAARVTLMDGCWIGFNTLLPSSAGEPLSNIVYDSVFAENQAQLAGDALGQLLVQRASLVRGDHPDARKKSHPTVAGDELVGYYEYLCQALLARAGAKPATVADNITAFIAPLRALLHTKERLKLINLSRARGESYRHGRDLRSRSSRREADEGLSRWIRANHILTRALSVGPSRTGGPVT